MAASAAHFQYSFALVRGLAASFEDSLKLEPPPVPIDVARAAEQHEAYTALLRTLVPSVVEVPADDAHPDCVFIEDAVVLAGPVAVLSHPGAPSRRGEVAPVRAALVGLGHPRLADLAPPATLDGGDVLFLGEDVLVGLSQRTNAEALPQLRAALEGSGLHVHGFAVPGAGAAGGALHFKSLLSALDRRTVLVADNAPGREVAAQLAPVLGPLGVRLVFVPDQLAANVLSIGPHVVMQEHFPASEAIIRPLAEAGGMTLHKLDMGELAKADGALTCCSVLGSLL